jgi:hypothetical protein
MRAAGPTGTSPSLRWTGLARPKGASTLAPELERATAAVAASDSRLKTLEPLGKLEPLREEERRRRARLGARLASLDYSPHAADPRGLGGKPGVGL